MNKISKLYTNWGKDDDTSLKEIEELSIIILAGNTSQISNKKIRKLVVCLRQEIHYRDAIIESYKQCEEFAIDKQYEAALPSLDKKRNKKEKKEKEEAIEQWLKVSDAPKSLHQKIRDDFNRWQWDTERILADCERIIKVKEENKKEDTINQKDYEYLR